MSCGTPVAMMILQARESCARSRSGWVTRICKPPRFYLRADPTDKLAALEAVMPPALRRGHFTVPDKLIALLHGE